MPRNTVSIAGVERWSESRRIKRVTTCTGPAEAASAGDVARGDTAQTAVADPPFRRRAGNPTFPSLLLGTAAAAEACQ